MHAFSNIYIKAKEELIQDLITKEKDNEKNLEDCEINIRHSKKIYDEVKSKHMELKINKAKVDEIVLNKFKELERISGELEEFYVKDRTFNAEIKTYNSELEASKSEIINFKAGTILTK